jgi:hypothetical protein
MLLAERGSKIRTVARISSATVLHLGAGVASPERDLADQTAASIAVHYILIYIGRAEQNKVCNLHASESLGDKPPPE